MRGQVAFLSISCFCCFELAVLAMTLWNSKAKVYFAAIVVATLGAVIYTVTAMVFFLTPPAYPANMINTILATIGYWIYVPAEFTVIYAR
jgi:hypothetical protein